MSIAEGGTRMRLVTAVVVLSSFPFALAADAQDVTEPKSGVKFAARVDDMTLLGVGLRTKTMLHVKVYAVGLYVPASAFSGPLAVHKGKTGTPAFYHDLVSGDFGKQIVMKFTRDLSASQIQDAFRETLANTAKSSLDLFVGFFGDIKSGQEA